MRRRAPSDAVPTRIRQGPRATARHHDWIDERSRALGEAIGRHVSRDPTLVADALRRLDEWEASARSHGDLRIVPVIREWRELLRTASREEIVALLGDDSPRAARLRQSSPFVGVLSEDERRAIFERFEAL